MIHILGALGGAAFTLVWVWLAHRWRMESWTYAGAMLLLPLFYMGFAALAGESALIGKEAVYGLPFFIGGVVLLLWRAPASLYVVASFWLAHAFYDFGHDLFFVNPGVWDIYPAFCAMIDALVGGYLIYLARQATAPNQNNRSKPIAPVA